MPAAMPANLRIFKNSRLAANGCWQYVGSIDRCGYGKMKGGKCVPGESLAHRCSYIVFRGEIPAGKEIHHVCNNRACCNPDHLEAVTHAENVALADYTTNHRNARKTHCKRGHEFTKNNTLIQKLPDGRRRRKCRKCCIAAVQRRKSNRSSGQVYA